MPRGPTVGPIAPRQDKKTRKGVLSSLVLSLLNTVKKIKQEKQ